MKMQHHMNNARALMSVDGSGYCRILLFVLCTLLSGCALPSLENRSVSSALADDLAKNTRLGQRLAPQVDAYPEKSGVYPLQDPHDAFAARIFLSRSAERTLDVQYYIWYGDMTGTLLLEALHTAADRGVRVRLLLDDVGTAKLDEELAALDSHDNIEVRLFNPFVVRSPKWLGFITDFPRANRRMHNKSFTADNMVTIIGGRNIGDKYFGADENMQFSDLDVLAVGPVVRLVSEDFDRYWSSCSAYPVTPLLPPVDPGRLEQLARKASIVESDPKASEYVEALREIRFGREFLSGNLELTWAQVYMVSDDPAKGLGLAEPEGLLTHQLEEIIGSPRSNVELVSPYFVPTAAGVRVFAAMAERGIKIRILTNSLEATDVTIVHAGYAKRRKALLKAGISLYEMQHLSDESVQKRARRPFTSSAASLHAKTFSVDSERVFVGSFNFDPRSSNLNTELGFVIDSPELAQRIEAVFNEDILANSYEVRLNEKGRIYWLERQGNERVRHDKEPHSGFWKRSSVFLLSLLPIEWLL